MVAMNRSGSTQRLHAPVRSVLLALALSAMVGACGGSVEAEGVDEGTPGEVSAELAAVTYICGYALPGYDCNNGRSSTSVVAADLNAAIGACRAVQPAAYSDFCYVIDAAGATPTDVAQCSAAAGSWRAGNNCCNFKGSVSCPTRSYTCGYALPGYNCNNGRSSKIISAADLTSAIASCRSVQPAAYSDFCYVIDGAGATQTDVFQCSAASASWRPGNNCCNFKGSLSCPN